MFIIIALVIQFLPDIFGKSDLKLSLLLPIDKADKYNGNGNIGRYCRKLLNSKCCIYCLKFCNTYTITNHALMIDAYINDLKVSKILSKTAFLSDVIKKSSMAELSHQKCPTLPEVVKTKVSNSGVVKTKVSSSSRGV